MANKTLEVWKGAFLRGIIVAGLTLFSSAVAAGFSWSTLEASLIAGGGYMFIELAKFYKINDKRAKSYHFILLP